MMLFNSCSNALLSPRLQAWTSCVSSGMFWSLIVRSIATTLKQDKLINWVNFSKKLSTLKFRKQRQSKRLCYKTYVFKLRCKLMKPNLSKSQSYKTPQTLVRTAPWCTMIWVVFLYLYQRWRLLNKSSHENSTKTFIFDLCSKLF